MNTSLKVGLVAAAVLVALGMTEKPDPTPTAITVDQTTSREATAAVAVRLVRANLRDPESFVLESAHASHSGNEVCITYRARNGFGGMNREWAVAVNIDKPDGFISTEHGEWAKHCSAPMLNVTDAVAAMD